MMQPLHPRRIQPGERVPPGRDPPRSSASSSASRPLVDGLLIGLLADGHVLLEGVPGLAKTLAVAVARDGARRARSAASSSRPTCCRPTSLGTQVYNPKTGDWTRARGAGLRELRARRRDQPRAGEGAVGAARGDAGAPGHARRRDAPAARRRSSCSRRRTRSSRRAPTRCPRRRSTASCSSSWSATRARTRRSAIVDAHGADARPPPAARCVASPEQVLAARALLDAGLRRREGARLRRRPRLRDARARRTPGSRPQAAASSTAPRRARRSRSRWPRARARSSRAAASSRRTT